MRTRKKQSRTGAVTDAIINYLSMIGWFVWRNNTTGVWDAKQQIYLLNKKQKSGVPDILGIDWNGRSVAVEVKCTGRLTAEQTMFAAETLARGGFYCIATNIEDVINTMKFFGYQISDSGLVLVHNMLTQQSSFEHHGIALLPNANLLKKLKANEKENLSPIAKDKMQKQFLKLLLQHYDERVV